jgi:hypothetical protein
MGPTLKLNDIVTIDNPPAHKAAGIGEAIEARGATLRYLPSTRLGARRRTNNSSPAPPHGPRFACNLIAREACNYFQARELLSEYRNLL